jgi:lysozyme family protein
MPSDAFNAALPFILRWEGGFVDNPNDPGGRTNKGVTQKVYDQWRTSQGAPTRDVKQIEDREVHAIYEGQYWLPPRCDLLQSNLDLVQFDTAVNMGVGRAVKLLQTTLNCGVDGDFGPGTQQAVATCEIEPTLAGYCNAREAYYVRLAEKNPKLKVFLKGWLNRLNSLRKEVGLPSPRSLDPVQRTMRIPDLGQDPTYDI